MELSEIMKRSAKIAKKRDRKKSIVLSNAVAFLSVVLIAAVGLFPRWSGSGTAYGDTVFGSFLLSSEAGGYVLAAVIAFVLGVIITFICLRMKKKNNAVKDQEDEQ